MTSAISRRGILAGAGVSLLPVASPAAEPPDPWPDLAAQIFGDRTIGDGAKMLFIDAPYRAEDAALVPIALRWAMPEDDRRRVRAVTLVIDQNPSPLAGKFSIGAGSGIDRIETRVRIDDYTNVHAVAELDDGSLLGSARFVKAAGGCSAPALKQTAGGVPLGTLRLREFDEAREVPATPAGLREAQIMVRHPNYSGMQMDPISRLYIPADFIRSLKIRLGDAPLLGVEGGISIAENPTFRFDYRANGADTFGVEAEDSEGRRFAATFPVSRSAT